MVHPDKRTLERVLRQTDIRAGLSLLPSVYTCPSHVHSMNQMASVCNPLLRHGDRPEFGHHEWQVEQIFKGCWKTANRLNPSTPKTDLEQNLANLKLHLETLLVSSLLKLLLKNVLITVSFTSNLSGFISLQRLPPWVVFFFFQTRVVCWIWVLEIFEDCLKDF